MKRIKFPLTLVTVQRRVFTPNHSSPTLLWPAVYLLSAQVDLHHWSLYFRNWLCGMWRGPNLGRLYHRARHCGTRRSLIVQWRHDFNDVLLPARKETSLYGFAWSCLWRSLSRRSPGRRRVHDECIVAVSAMVLLRTTF
jgi:hypothetical protein